MWVGSLGSGRFPGGGNGNPLQYSCPENPMDRRVQQATVHGVTELDMTEVTQHTCAESSNESKDFPGGSDSEESACNEGDLGSIPGLGRSPGGGNCNPLQYFCLENPHGQRSLAGYNPWGCKESDTTERPRAAHSRGCIVSASHCCRWDQRRHLRSFLLLLSYTSFNIEFSFLSSPLLSSLLLSVLYSPLFLQNLRFDHIFYF